MEPICHLHLERKFFISFLYTSLLPPFWCVSHHLCCCHRFDVRALVRSLAMINAIEVMNKSPLLTAANVTLGYLIVDSCSDVSTALRAIADITQEADCSTCDQPVTAVIGASISEISIAMARQLTLNMIPQVSGCSDSLILGCYEEVKRQNRFAGVAG